MRLISFSDYNCIYEETFWFCKFDVMETFSIAFVRNAGEKIQSFRDRSLKRVIPSNSVRNFVELLDRTKSRAHLESTRSFSRWKTKGTTRHNSQLNITEVYSCSDKVVTGQNYRAFEREGEEERERSGIDIISVAQGATGWWKCYT